METLSLIYVIKLCLGAATAIICLLLSIDDIILAAGIGIMVYMGSDRLLKQIFIEKVEKQSVVTRTGVGAFVVTWIFLWVLLYTLMRGLSAT